MTDSLRVWDANLNRLREGLRVLEEAARFLLDDAALATRLKALRHRFATAGPLARDMLSERRAAEDVGAAPDFDTASRADWQEVVLAGARRAEESLRVLEELAKLPDTPMAAPFKESRFELYDMEKELVGRLSRRGRTKAVRGLYAIVDTDASLGRSPVEVAAAVIAGGASVVQLRDKMGAKGDRLEDARQVRQLCADAGVLFIVNDHIDLALAADADGVHLGQHDLPTDVARRILPIDRLIGRSANTVAEALAAQAAGADYLGAGAVFGTATKADARSGSVERLREIAAVVSIPVVGIGGITADNVGQVVAAGAAGAAVISAICGAPDVAAAARRIVAAMEAAWKS